MEDSKFPRYCLCGVYLTGKNQIEGHETGKRHKVFLIQNQKLEEFGAGENNNNNINNNNNNNLGR